MNLLPWKQKEPDVVERDQSFLVPFQEYVDWLSYQGTFYPFSGMTQTLRNEREEIGNGFTGMVSAYMSNTVVFACMDTRFRHFSEARFIYRQRVKGKAGDLFGTPDLAILEQPYGPGSSSGDLLGRMIQDVDLAGNSYHVRVGDRLARLRPDWVAIVLGSRTRRENFIPGDPDTVVAGFLYYPGGPSSGEDAVVFLPEQVAHFIDKPDPLASFRGMSWLTGVIRDVQSDSMLTGHKTKFLENGATPNMIVKFPAGITRDNFNDAVNTIKSGHEGARNFGKTLFLAGGADATVVGANFQQLDFRSVQGAGETRIAAAAGTPPVIVGLSEGLQGSSLNAGNYQSARRMFADGTMRPLWRKAAGSMSRIVVVPGGSELWFDDRDVAFLREDLKDRAEVQQLQSTAIKTLLDAGFEPDACVLAVTTDDLSRLSGQHSGLTSVQLQPMDGNINGNGTAVPSQNGANNGNG